MKATAVLAEGRRTGRAAALIVAFAWAAPAFTFGWAVCEALGRSPAWALVPAGLAGALVLRARRFDERMCVARLESALGTEGALELALDHERGRELPARSAAAIAARVAERADRVAVRRVALVGAPRHALVGLAIATFGLIALGVVRNVQVMTRGPMSDANGVARTPGAVELSPTERQALLEALREAREEGWVDAESAPEEPDGPIDLVMASAEADPEPKAQAASKGAAEQDLGQGVAPGPGAQADDSVEAQALPDSLQMSPLGASGEGLGASPGTPDLPAGTANGVTPGPNGGRMVAPEAPAPRAGLPVAPPAAAAGAPAWWPRHQRAVVDAFLGKAP